MNKENAFPVSFMMQPISFQMSAGETDKDSVVKTNRSHIKDHHFLNSLEQRRLRKHNFLKEQLRDIS